MSILPDIRDIILNKRQAAREEQTVLDIAVKLVYGQKIHNNQMLRFFLNQLNDSSLTKFNKRRVSQTTITEFITGSIEKRLNNYTRRLLLIVLGIVNLNETLPDGSDILLLISMFNNGLEFIFKNLTHFKPFLFDKLYEFTGRQMTLVDIAMIKDKPDAVILLVENNAFPTAFCSTKLYTFAKKHGIIKKIKSNLSRTYFNLIMEQTNYELITVCIINNGFGKLIKSLQDDDGHKILASYIYHKINSSSISLSVIEVLSLLLRCKCNPNVKYKAFPVGYYIILKQLDEVLFEMIHHGLDIYTKYRCIGSLYEWIKIAFKSKPTIVSKNYCTL